MVVPMHASTNRVSAFFVHRQQQQPLRGREANHCRFAGNKKTRNLYVADAERKCRGSVQHDLFRMNVIEVMAGILRLV